MGFRVVMHTWALSDLLTDVMGPPNAQVEEVESVMIKARLAID